MYHTIEFKQDHYVARITLNRPGVLNAINVRMRQELCDALAGVGDSDARVLLLCGAGERGFSAGADVKELTELRSLAEERQERLRFDPWIALAGLRIPTIAAIHGYTLGGGAELALACDIRLAAASAQIGFPETGIGMLPGAGGTQRLPRTIGESRALEMILAGRRVGAEEASAIGLVNRVLPDEELVDAALKLASEIAKRAPVAIRYAKEAVKRGLELPLAAALKVEIDLLLFLYATEDRAEGAKAFAEKRKPVFKGR